MSGVDGILRALESWGWNEEWAAAFAPSAAAGLTPARVISQQRGRWLLAGEIGEWLGLVTGKFRHDAAMGDLPAVGDWIGCAMSAEHKKARPGREDARHHAARIDIVLPRHTALTRRAAGSRVALQVVAANVDVLLVATSVNGDLNPRRLERYVAMGKDSGAETIVVLTKSDLSDDGDALVAELAEELRVRVVALSGRTGEGLDAVSPWLQRGRTLALVGSSGVGKSTLLNRLAGRQLMDTSEIREDDDRGRHTTTHRELFRLPGGALLLDTPGMRELGLWDAEDGVDETFDELVELALSCRFADCSHTFEPGCAVLAAVAAGSVDAGRLASYRGLNREMADQHPTAERRAKDRRFNKAARDASAQAADRRANRHGD